MMRVEAEGFKAESREGWRTPPRVFLRKSLELQEKKEFRVLMNAKEFVRI
jgi:hypothetical protein